MTRTYSAKDAKNALGFAQFGFITIYAGNTFPVKDAFKAAGARYNKNWGWSFPGEAPITAPEGTKAIRLDWDLVGNADNTLKTETEIKEVVDSLIYDPDKSQFIGNIGDRIEATVVVERSLELAGFYGKPSFMHIMRDEDGNILVWTTASKHWAEGSTKTIRGTIKDHKVYRNAKQTVLTRCMEMGGK